jgi:hypothetical protein
MDAAARKEVKKTAAAKNPLRNRPESLLLMIRWNISKKVYSQANLRLVRTMKTPVRSAEKSLETRFFCRAQIEKLKTIPRMMSRLKKKRLAVKDLKKPDFLAGTQKKTNAMANNPEARASSNTNRVSSCIDLFNHDLLWHSRKYHTKASSYLRREEMREPPPRVMERKHHPLDIIRSGRPRLR